MRLAARLRKVESQAEKLRLSDRCRHCGYPEKQVWVFISRGPEQPFGECEACGRPLTPDGRPFDPNQVKLIILHLEGQEDLDRSDD